MSWLITSISMVVLSITLYHTFQKSVSRNVPPLLALSVTYAVACAIATSVYLLALRFHAGAVAPAAGLRQLNWASFALAFAMIGADIGFLLGYRAGWNIVRFPIASNVSVALVLIPVGSLLFKEKISPVNVVGVFVCIAGLVLLNRK